MQSYVQWHIWTRSMLQKSRGGPNLMGDQTLHHSGMPTRRPGERCESTGVMASSSCDKRLKPRPHLSSRTCCGQSEALLPSWADSGHTPKQLCGRGKPKPLPPWLHETRVRACCPRAPPLLANGKVVFGPAVNIVRRVSQPPSRPTPGQWRTDRWVH